jgi:hypothetical protein
MVLNTPGHCMYSLHIYPTSEFEDGYRSSFPIFMTIMMTSAFLFMIGVFFMYEYFVQRSNTKTTHAAVQSNSLVTALFPTVVRDRLLAEQGAVIKAKTQSGNGTSRLKSYLASGGTAGEENEEHDDDFYKTKPIADLFPEATILFADIAGFTAWSSTREPSQVFILLETIYKAFDGIAKTRRVFKVETVGDCYVSNDQSVRFDSIRSLVWLCFQAGFKSQIHLFDVWRF